MSRGGSLLMSVLLGTALGCDRATPASQGSEVSDSAGIRIVESAEARWGGASPIDVADEVLMEIGSASGSMESQLFSVSAVRFLDRERVVLGNAGHEVRIYDRRGSLIRRFGREGEGPGDFERISGISVLDGGDILVVDAVSRRLTQLDTLGNLVRVLQVARPTPDDPRLVGGQWLVGRARGQAFVFGDQPRRVVDTVIAIDVETGESRAWATTPGSRLQWVRDPSSIELPLGLNMGPVAQVVAYSQGVAFGSPDRYEVRMLGEDGQLQAIARRIVAARPMSSYYEAPYRERWADEASLDWYEPEFADSVPHFTGLAVDADERLWVQLEQGGYRPDRIWDVFDPDGSWLGTVRMPAGFRIHDYRSNEVAGVRRDELGVEYVQIRRLSIPNVR